MIIKNLKLTRFRNLEDTGLEFHERGHLIIGDNAQGKTNLLEAINYLTVLRSFRSLTDKDCIRFGAEYFQLSGGWVDEAGEAETIAVGYSGRRKKVTLAGKDRQFISEAFGRFKSVILTPEDIAIIQQGPSERRKYLDIVLSIISPDYLERLKRYRKALASRNVLLRRTPFSESQVLPWERQMVENGAWIIRDRRDFLGALGPGYAEIFSRLSGGESGALSYNCALLDSRGTHAAASIDEIMGLFEDGLARNRAVERERGITLTGPQTDEIVFEITDLPLRNFGSQGQQRTAVICLKLAETGYLKGQLGIRSVLLLDDIFAELDLHRSLRLLEELVQSHQSFITAPRKESVFERLGHLPVKYIHQGVIRDG